MEAVNQIKWTSPCGDNYKVIMQDGYYRLYVNDNFYQNIIKADGIEIGEASRILVNQYNEAGDAELRFFKNNPQLNP